MALRFWEKDLVIPGYHDFQVKGEMGKLAKGASLANGFTLDRCIQVSI